MFSAREGVMKKLIIITGPVGVGKTTVSKKVCNKLGRCAFIDGDWCLDIHPFVGNKETKTMAINNILHMIKNYYLCSECDIVVVGWVMSENTVDKIILGISDTDFKIYNFVLTCSKNALIDRWKKDTVTEWRNDEELNNSIKSFDNYNQRKKPYLIDTSNISADIVADKVIEKLL